MSRASVRYKKTYNGVRIDLTAPDQDELDEKVRQYKNRIDAGLHVKSAMPTVETWGRMWLETYKKPKIAPKNYTNQDAICRNYIYPAIGKVRICDVTNIALHQILLSQAGMSKSHVSHIRSVLTDMFKQARINRYINDDPSFGLYIPDNVTEGTHRPLTDTETTALLALCEKHYLGLIILTLYYCGLRPSEATALQYKDYDSSTRRLHIRGAMISGTKTKGDTKTFAGNRVLPVPIPLAKKLDALASDKPDDYIFHDLQGNVLYDDRFQRYFEIFRRLWDIEMGATVKNHQVTKSKFAGPMTAYCLRHNYCTNLLRMKIPLSRAKYLMGHKDTRMVDRIYGHITDDQVSDAQQKLDEFYGEKGTSIGTKNGK
jgi:integrase